MAGLKIPVSVLVVMYSPNGDFLLIQRADNPEFWQSVTGSVDALDEPLLDTAQRELFEETGFRVQPVHTQTVQSAAKADLCEPWQLRAWPHSLQYEIYPQWQHRYPEGTKHNTEHWFAACVPNGALPTLAPREHIGFQWLTAQQAAARCFSPNNAQAISALAGVLGVAI